MVLHLPVALAAVSEAVHDILLSEFGRRPMLIPNGVDCERFYPGPRAHISPEYILSAPPAKYSVCLNLQPEALENNAPPQLGKFPSGCKSF